MNGVWCDTVPAPVCAYTYRWTYIRDHQVPCTVQYMHVRTDLLLRSIRPTEQDGSELVLMSCHVMSGLRVPFVTVSSK